MKCEIKPEDLDKARNLGVNKRPIIQVPLRANQESTLKYFTLNKELIEVNPNKQSEQYQLNYVFKNSEVVAASKRVSQIADEMYRKRTGAGPKAKVEETVGTKIGTLVHEVHAAYLSAYTEAYYEGKKADISKVAAKYKGQLGLTDKHIASIEQQSRKLFEQIVDTQKSIDPKKKALIMVESIVWSPIDDLAGTVDLLAQYSDGSASWFDFKTYKPKKVSAKGEPLAVNIQGQKEEDYRVSATTYTDILSKNLNIKTWRHVRLIPIMVNNDGSKVTSLKTIDDVSDEAKAYLEQIPLLAEYSENDLTNKALKELINLRNAVAIKKLSYKMGTIEREMAAKKYNELNQAVKDIMLKKDLKNLFDGIRVTFEELRDMANIPVDQLVPYYTELQALLSIIEQEGHAMINAAPAETRNDLRTSMHLVQGRISEKMLNLEENITQEVKRLFTSMRVEDKETLDQLTFTNLFDRATNSNIPHIKAMGLLLAKAQDKRYLEMMSFNEKINTIDNKVRNWAKDKGMKVQEAYDMLLTDKSNLISEIDSAFWETAKTASDTWLKEHFELRPDAKEKHAELKKRQSKFLNDLYENNKEVYGEAKAKQFLEESWEKWESEHSLDAYLTNKTKRGYYWKPTEKSYAQYKSAAYAKIKGTPLEELYNFLLDFNKEADSILGKDIKNTFVPWIRKSMVETFNELGISSVAEIKKRIQEFGSIRQGETAYGEIDEATGEVIRKIPEFFTNPFRDADGKLQFDQKSRDLVTSFKIFAKDTVYNYKYLQEVEPLISMLRTSLYNNSTVEIKEGAKEALGKLKEKMYKKASIDTELITQFDAIMTQGLYGVTTQNGDINLGPVKIPAAALNDLKQINAVRLLGLNWVAGVASYIAPKVFIRNFASKGRLWNTEQNNQANKWIIGRDKDAARFTDYFNTFSEDMQQREALKSSTSRKYLNENVWFAAFSMPDRLIDMEIALSMSQNYGFKDGQIKRLENIPGSKSIMELFKEGYKFSIDEYSQFRQAFKSAGEKIKGTMPTDEYSAYKSNLFLSTMMQFKTWMPGVLNERFGKLKYNNYLDTADLGTHTALLMEFHKEQGLAISDYMSTVVVPKIGSVLIDLATFGVLKNSNHRVNLARAEAYYEKWRLENPTQAEQVSFEDFVELKREQIGSALKEIRMLLGSLLLLFALGLKDDDGEEYYKQNLLTRNVYRVLNKTYSELAFVYNPSEFLRVVDRPLPLLSLLRDSKNLISNSADEMRDALIGQNSPNDRTPMFYYTSKFIPGATGTGRFLEYFKEQENYTGETK